MALGLYFRRNIIFILLSVFLTAIVATNIQPLSKDISLIYKEDHNGKFYCRFATEAELAESEGSVINSCHNKFKEMAQILSNGSVTRPFLEHSHWDKKGYVLACKKLNIPNGILGECNPGLKTPLVHTVCTYHCAPGFIATSNSVTCSLMGPLKNVSVQWLKDRDFFVPDNLESEYCKQLVIPNGKLGVCSMDSDHKQLHCNYSCDPDCIATNSTEILHFDMNNYSSFQSSSVKELCIRDPTIEQLPDKHGMLTFTMLVAVSVSLAIAIIIIAILILALQYSQRKLKPCKDTDEQQKMEEYSGRRFPTNDTSENVTLLQDPVSVLPNDNRQTVTPTATRLTVTLADTRGSVTPADTRGTVTPADTMVGFQELPVDHPSHTLTYLPGGKIQRFNQDRDNPEKVGTKDRPGLYIYPDLQSVMRVFDEPLNDDSTLEESQQKYSRYACGAELMAGGTELKAVGTELKAGVTELKAVGAEPKAGGTELQTSLSSCDTAGSLGSFHYERLFDKKEKPSKMK